MAADQRILDRLGELIEVGERVLGTRRPSPPNFIGFDSTVDSETAYQWFTSAQSILARVFGVESEHYRNFTAQKDQGLTYSPVRRAQGVLKAAHEDFERGFIFELKRLIEADVFDDLLEQASVLLDAGYHQAAAVVAGCVLEDGLRKLCTAAGVVVNDKSKLDTMNAGLAKAAQFNKLTQKRITALADIRNNAAHAHCDRFTRSDVKDMIVWIRGFMEDQFR